MRRCPTATHVPPDIAPGHVPGSVAEAGGDSCTPVQAPLTSIPALAGGEPQLAIPQPAGWERNTMLDSRLIRFALVNKSLIANRFAPTVVVTLESADGARDARKLLEQGRSALVTMGGATDLKVKPATLCGQPAETVDYVAGAMGQLAAHPATVLAAVMQAGGTTYFVTVTIQTTDADNPTYRRDAETILTGFTFLHLPPRLSTRTGTEGEVATDRLGRHRQHQSQHRDGAEEAAAQRTALDVLGASCLPT